MKRYILPILLLACLLLTACGTSPDGTPDTTAADTPATTAAETAPAGPLQLSGGTPYTVIRADAAGKDAVGAATAMVRLLGGETTIASDWAKPGDTATVGTHEVLVGATNRPESAELSAGLGAHDYRIAVMGEKLVIAGGSEAATANAVAALIRSGAIVNGSLARDYSLAFDGADDRDAYIADPESFLCRWALEFDVPDWMTDWEEKLAAFADGDGRMMSSVHRGDFTYYPENSIEGIISAIQMGADNIELDLRLTRDGVVVLMHDETLARTTDWAEKKGKNGLPGSGKVADWSFEELRQLRLKMNDGTKTDYLIPTFEEALTVCRGRTTIRLDKPEVWDWEDDVWPLVQKTGAWQTCILNYHFTLGQQKKILNAIKAEGGVEPLLYFKFSHAQNERENWRNLLDQLQKMGLPVIARYNGFGISEAEKYISEAKVQLAQVRDDIRFYVDAQALGGGAETVEQWDYLYANGIDFLLVDNALAFQRYIAENYTATLAAK